ncbi:MAG: LysR substrate-binding domain-containing protein [Pseudomonadota bacterium]
MPSQYFDHLRVFTLVAQHKSLTDAADALHLTKGAVSYQISKLEERLGFAVFRRSKTGIQLTEKGRELYKISAQAFDALDAGIEALQESRHAVITIGMTTYFASRWLSPRLMNFTSTHPDIGLRLQPTTGLVDPAKEGIDMLIRWGDGRWSDLEIAPLFMSPVAPTSGQSIAQRVDHEGLEHVLKNSILLHDYEGSHAWRDWHDAAGIAYKPDAEALVIPDPNVRVQAVIDGQGIALNDGLVDAEIRQAQLTRLSDSVLEKYGYFLAYPKDALDSPALRAFHDWLLSEVRQSELTI